MEPSLSPWLTLKGHEDTVECIAYSPDGKHIATGSDDNTTRIWDAATGRELLKFKRDGIGGNSVAFSPDSKHIILADTKKEIGSTVIRGYTVWDIATRKKASYLKGGDWDVAYSPDGKRIYTGGAVWNAATGHRMLTLKGDASGSAAFSPDGKHIITDGTVWDAVTGQRTLTLRGLKEGINSVAFSPDGKRIVTGTGSWGLLRTNAENAVKIWDAMSGRELLSIKGYTKAVRCVAFSPDGKRIATNGDDNLAKVWDATTGHELLSL